MPLSGGTFTGAVRQQGAGANLSLEGTGGTNPPYSIVNDIATTNLWTNPSMETNTTGFTGISTGVAPALAQYVTEQYIGSNCLRVTKTTALANDGVETNALAGFTNGVVYVVSWFQKNGPSATLTSRYQATVVDGNGGSTTGGISTQDVDEFNWTRNYIVHTVSGAVPATLKLQIRSLDAIAQLDLLVDGVQFEQTTYTSYCDGSLGPGYSWSGTAHASASSRVAGIHFLNPVTGTQGTWVINRLGNMVFGTELFQVYPLTIYKETIRTSEGFVSGNFVAVSNASAASTATITGVDANASVKLGNTRNHTGAMNGMAGSIIHGGSGTITNAHGVSGIIFVGFQAKGGAGVVTNALAFRAYNAAIDSVAGGTITVAVGFRADSQNLGSTATYAFLADYPGIANGIGATTDLMAFKLIDGTIAVGNQTATTTFAIGMYLGVVTYTSTTNVRTVTIPVTFFVGGAPVASTNVTFASGPYAVYISTGLTFFAEGPVKSGHDRKWWAQVNTGLATMSTVGNSLLPTITSAVAATNQRNTRGDWVRISATTNNADSSIAWAAYTHTRIDWDPIFTTMIEIPTALTNRRIWCGLFASTPAASDDPAINHLSFRYSTGTSDTVWQCCANDGSGGGTITASPVTVAADTRYVLMIDATSAASIKFYINWRLVATITTNLPAVTADLGMANILRSLSATVQKDLDTSYMMLEQVA